MIHEIRQTLERKKQVHPMCVCVYFNSTEGFAGVYNIPRCHSPAMKMKCRALKMNGLPLTCCMCANVWTPGLLSLMTQGKETTTEAQMERRRRNESSYKSTDGGEESSRQTLSISRVCLVANGCKRTV